MARGRGSARVEMVSDTLTPNLRRLPGWAKDLAKAVTAFYAPQVENYARLNAPWSDQTGNARNGLIARASKENGWYGITLAHSVPYGIWLEVRWAGKYAIILPTVEAMGPKVMGTFNRGLNRYPATGPRG